MEKTDHNGTSVSFGMGRQTVRSTKTDLKLGDLFISREVDLYCSSARNSMGRSAERIAIFHF